MPTNNAIVAEIDRVVKQELEQAERNIERAKAAPSVSSLYSARVGESMHAINKLRQLREFIQGKGEKNE